MKAVYFGTPAPEDGQGGPRRVLPVPSPWTIPPGLKTALVDRTTGKLASRWCPAEGQYLEYFIPGTEPTEFCDNSGGRRFRNPR